MGELHEGQSSRREPLVSVVIPAYNSEGSVEKAALSVLEQPCADRIELILVDDGSKDGTGAVCDRIGAEHRNVTVIHKENGGVSSARNLGIERSAGLYCAFLDADDWWTERFFDEAVAELLNGRFDVYQFSYRKVSESGKYIQTCHAPEQELFFTAPDCSRNLPMLHHCSYFYRRSFLMEHGIRYLPCSNGEDTGFLHLVLSLCASLKAIDKTVFCYWMNPKSILHTANAQKILTGSCKKLRLEEESFRAHGFDYSNDRAMVSTVVSQLPELCCELSFRDTIAFLEQTPFSCIYRDAVPPWRYLQKQWKGFRKHPRLFWLRSRVFPGMRIGAERLLIRVRFLQPVREFLHYRLLFRWERAGKNA